MTNIATGFREIDHTADWELEVWAPNLTLLMETAARGMYAISGTKISDHPRQKRILNIAAEDAEGSLVKFLSELLFLQWSEGLAFDKFLFIVAENHIVIKIEGVPVISTDKEIKAVTYHRMAVQETESGMNVRIVFDV